MPISRSDRSKSANIASKNAWPNAAPCGRFRFEPVEIEKGVQADQLEAPVERVGDAALGEENRVPGLLHDTPVS